MSLFDMAKNLAGEALQGKDMSSLFAQFSGQGPMIELMKVVQGQAGMESLTTIFADGEARDQLISQIMQFTGIKFDAASNSFTHGGNQFPASAEGLVGFVKAFLGK